MNNFNDLFTAEEITAKKAEAFDKLSEIFYNGNFGTVSKSDIELLMFSIYMDAMIEKYQDENGVLDYSACSDYNMGHQLGIPQEKVRSLKVRKQARYPHKFDWRSSLKSIKNSIVYDEGKKKIIIPLRDPNLYNEIRNFIEENGGYIEIQRSGNFIQIRPEYFFILLYKATDNEAEKEEIRKNFAKKLREHNEEVDIDSIKTDDELSKAALEYTDNFFDLAVDVVEGVNNPLVGVIKVFQAISKNVRIKRGY